VSATSTAPVPAAAARPAPAARRRGPTVRTARYLLWWILRVAVWFWPILVLLVVSVRLVLAATGVLPTSILAGATQAGVWFPFSLLIGIAATYPQVHVAAGMTRRSYLRGVLIAVVVSTATSALLMTLALRAERAWYDAMGWTWSLDGRPDSPVGWVTGVLLPCAAMFLVAHLSGLLVGTVYASRGGWWGTLTLPLTAGPVMGVGFVVGGFFGDLDAHLSIGVRALVVVAAVVSMVCGLVLLTVRRPIRPRSS
jgi:hypothetical protein